MAEKAPGSHKGLYTFLAIIVVVAVIAMFAVANLYEPGDGGYDPDSVIVGLVWGVALNSIVLFVLLMTLRTAVATVTAAEEVKKAAVPISKTEEKEHVIIIEGIGEAYATRLNQMGVITVPQLLAAQPEQVAAQIGVTSELVREWQAAGQLMKIKGIGPQYAEILVMAGIRTIGELAQSEPKALSAKIDAIEESRKVRVLGTDVKIGHVEKWVQAAKDYLTKN